MMMMKKIVISKNQKGYFTQTKLKTCSLTNPAVRDGADCPKMEFFIRNRFGSMSAPTPTNINDQNSRDTSFITTLNSSMQETYSLHKAQLFHPKVICWCILPQNLILFGLPQRDVGKNSISLWKFCQKPYSCIL